jgi:hypothetical protein
MRTKCINNGMRLPQTASPASHRYWGQVLAQGHFGEEFPRAKDQALMPKLE